VTAPKKLEKQQRRDEATAQRKAARGEGEPENATSDPESA